MPDFPSRSDSTVPPAADSALDELLTAGHPPPDAAPELQPVAAVLAALRAGPADGELAGQTRALAEFRSTVRVSHRAGPRRARRPVPFRERLSSKLAVITAAAAVSVSGTVAAAYVGALPGPLQRAAHDVIAAPKAGAGYGRPTPAALGARRLHTRPAPARPLPTGSAAVPASPVTGAPGWRYGQYGSPGKHDRYKRYRHHKDHRGRRADHQEGGFGNQQGNGPAARQSPVAHYQGNMLGDGPAARRHNPVAGNQGDRLGDGPAARRDDNPKAHHKGSRLQSPLPKAAAFPIPPAGPGRPGAGGR
jgi:hypothetical protein